MNILFFRFYLLLLLIILLILSFFISSQLRVLVLNNIRLNYLLSSFKGGLVTSLDDFSLFNCYLFRGQLLTSISLCEFLLESKKDNKIKASIFILLANLYSQRAFYSIAEYYYHKVLFLLPKNDKARSSLVEMYKHLGHEINNLN
uniref:Photosystem I assembly protein Ycf37 n=1 Tax=Herposiphonia versicolor TaxID=2007163 RepID=A0A1Z1MFT1_9FLOR|nr:hypothetical protein [Herposiphonia versicolor]ARW64675.1 hypothetical protein [Herposiphonia versicolor]